MYDINIHWFPGHMAKAHRMIQEQIKLIDVVVELLDARIPRSSSNPAIVNVINDRPRVVVLNKADLADENMTINWLDKFRENGLKAVAIDSVTGKGVSTLLRLIEGEAREKLSGWVAKGIKQRAVRVMILGIPNVGKSSLINRLKGSNIVRTADKPGVTRGQQWIKIGRNLELLDTPGVLWPKLDDPQVAFRLALTGAINDEVYDLEKVVLKFIEILVRSYPERLASRYGLTVPLEQQDATSILEAIGVKRGCLRSGGVIDHQKAIRILLGDYRAGKLGRFTLDNLD